MGIPIFTADGRTLYVTNEGDPNGFVSALNIDDVTQPKLLMVDELSLGLAPSSDLFSVASARKPAA